VEENFSWRKTQNMILDGKLETNETVYSEYAGWNQMADREEYEGLKDKFSTNSSRAVVKGNRGLVQNSQLSDFQFRPNEQCYSEERKCFEDQEDLETKLQIVLGPRD
jgi:hypothetical protein